VTEQITPTAYTPGAGRAQPSAKPPRRRWPWLLALLLLPLAFVFLAQGMTVQTTPASAEVRLSGGLSLELADRYLVLPGTYTVEARAPGYEPLRQPLVVESGQNPQLRLTLQPAPGIVSLRVLGVRGNALEAGQLTLQSGATARAEAALTVPAGLQEGVVSAPGYEPLAVAFTVAGRGREQMLTVQLERAWANIGASTAPEGAEIWLDGAATGALTPATLAVPAGEHRVEFRRSGYSPRAYAFLARPRQDQALPRLSLAPASVSLALGTAPPGAAVSLNGQPQGTTPLTLALVPNAPYRIEVLKAGFERAVLSDRAPAQGSLTRTLTLTAELGEVQLSFTPKDATLRLDGAPQVWTGAPLQLPARPVTLRLEKPGYVPFERTVTPRPGFPQAVDVRLLTVAEARRAAMKPSLTAADGQTLLLLKGGAFPMGASRREPGRRANEVLRDVEVTRPFYLGEKEVTNAQFAAFAPRHRSGEFEGTSLEEPDHPVVQVSWLEAVRYCNWLSAQEGLPLVYAIEGDEVRGFNPNATGYRLPTEAEWAFAARLDQGAPPRTFPWGETRAPEKNRQGNFADDTVRHLLARTIPTYLDGHLATAPVGTFAPNGFGLYDLGGNVAEWINDFYGATAEELGQAVRDPLGPGRGRYHVIRGSSWMHGQLVDLRLSFRDYGETGRQDLGFRVARWFEPLETP
jgi:formylglycine-generating enzyme required for sulfatase activity